MDASERAQLRPRRSWICSARSDWLRGEVPQSPSAAGPNRVPIAGEAATVRAARRLNRAAGMIAASVLADSAMEHYRGDFHNKAMWTPIVSAALSLAASVHGHTDRRHRRASGPGRDLRCGRADRHRSARASTSTTSPRSRAGFCWQNLFYSAPIGAPAALSLSGLMGFLSERVRNNRPGTRPTDRRHAGRPGGGGADQRLAARHGGRGRPAAFPRRLPQSVHVAAGFAAADRRRAARQRRARQIAHVRRPFTRWWLRATTLMGIAGVAFHAYGVSRNMGGWRNWRQNAFNGPPLPAPPSFTGLALAGLAALGLLEDHPDD